MSHSKEELDYSDDFDRDHFGRRDRAVDHGVSHPAAVKAAKGEPPCDCCHHYATESDEQAGVLTWRKPTTYADCYVHASRCNERPDAELYHHVLIPFVQELVEAVDTGNFEELVWPDEIEAEFEEPPKEWLKELRKEVDGDDDDAIDVTVTLDWEHLRALQQLATQERRAGVPLSPADQKAVLGKLRTALTDTLTEAVDEVRSEQESGSLADHEEWFFTGVFWLIDTNIGGSYGYIHGNRAFESGMRFVTINNPTRRK